MVTFVGVTRAQEWAGGEVIVKLKTPSGLTELGKTGEKGTDNN